MKYITRDLLGTKIQDCEKQILTKGLIQSINELCIKNLSTYQGRKEASKKILKRNCNLPIYVDRKTILFPTKSIREYDVVFVNYIRVISITKYKQMFTKIIFDDLTELVVLVTVNKIKEQMKRIEIILNIKNNT